MPRVPWRLALLAVSAAALVGVAGGLAAHLALAASHGRPALALPKLHGQATWKPGAKPAPAFSLRDEDGRTVSPRSVRGRTVLLAFLNSHCTTSCPLEGAAIGAVERSLPAGARPAVLIVSVNPKDTPASVRAAARRWRIGGDWHWLLGGRAALRRVWRAYGITVEPVPGDVVHSTAVYLLDRQGFERDGYLYPFLPNFVALDLRALAREAA